MGKLNPRLSVGGRLRSPTLAGLPRLWASARLRASELGRLRRLLTRVARCVAAAAPASLLVLGVMIIPWPESSAPDRPHPATPDVAVPAIEAPEIRTPDMSAPDLDALRVGTPDLDVDPPAVGLPDVNSSSGEAANSEPTPPQTYRRFVNLHVHEWSIWWHWQWPWWPLAALGVIAALFARRRQPQWLTPPLVALAMAVTAALAIGAWADAVTVPDSSGQPVRFKSLETETKQLSGGDRERVTTREARHRHLPIEVRIHWLLIGLAAGAATVRQRRLLHAIPRSSNPSTARRSKS